MTRSMVCLSVSCSLWFAMAGTASAQAMLEYGLGASRAVTTAAPAAGIGKSMSGLAGSVDKALKAAGKQSSEAQPAAAAAAVTAAAPAAKAPAIVAEAPPAPTPNWEDPSGIETGLDYEELVRRFGPSAMAITDGTERSLTYRGKDGMFQVKVLDGAVKSIAKPQPRG
jgi:hypothetical protein